MTPGQRCDEIIRLIEEALDGAPQARLAPPDRPADVRAPRRASRGLTLVRAGRRARP